MRFSPVASLVQNLVFDTVRQFDDSHLPFTICEVLERFNGEELSSITFVNSASATLMDPALLAEGEDPENCNDTYRHFLMRFRDTSSFIQQIVRTRELQGIRTRKFSVPGAYRTYSIGCSGLVLDSNLFSTLRQLELFVFTERLYQSGDQDALVCREASDLVSFINKCPQPSKLTLSTTGEISARFPISLFTSTVSSGLINLPLLETVNLTGWQKVTYISFLSFLAASPRISHIELVEMSIYAAELPARHHVGWVNILRHLLEYKSLTHFAWRHLLTTGELEEYTLTGIAPLNPPTKIETSTHVRACNK